MTRPITPAGRGAAPPGRWGDLRAAMRADLSAYAPGAAALRALRMARVAGFGAAHRALAANPALRAHVAAVDRGDPLFWLSHRHYLARGLSVRERAALAVAHYGHEAGRMGGRYLEAVYGGEGLTLWAVEVKGVAYELRLMPGNDVLYEGGLSLVLHVDGVRVCVLSFSWAPERIALGSGGEAVLPFVTRKQLTGDRGYQKAFHAAFDRVTPAHLCLGALGGLAEALGVGRMVGIAAARHPSVTPERLAPFEAAYDEFWRSLGGEAASPLGFVVDLPERPTPLEGMDAARRKRALARRAHAVAVRAAAAEAVRALLPPS